MATATPQEILDAALVSPAEFDERIKSWYDFVSPDFIVELDAFDEVMDEYAQMLTYSEPQVTISTNTREQTA